MTRAMTSLVLLRHPCFPAPALAQPSTRPVRVVLIVDATDAIRQPIGHDSESADGVSSRASTRGTK